MTVKACGPLVSIEFATGDLVFVSIAENSRDFTSLDLSPAQHMFHSQVKQNYFYAPEIEDREAYCFCPVCHSVLLSETLTLLITFEQ